MNELVSVVIVALLVINCIVACYSMVMVQKRADNQFKIQIESLKHRKNDYISNKPYTELISFVDSIINAQVMNTVVKNALWKKSEEELSVIMDDVLVDICTKVKSTLSQDIMIALTAYVHEDFLNRYIVDTATLHLIARTSKNISIKK